MPPLNGSGNFSRNFSWQADAAASIPITASRMDGDSNDIATALSNAMYKDGQSTPTANIKMGGFKLTALGAGTASTDAVNLANVQAGASTQLGTVSGTDTITAAGTPTFTAYTTGMMVKWVAAGANTTTTVTLNIDGLGAKAVTKRGATALAIGDIASGMEVVAVYDGTQFQAINISTQFAGGTVASAITAPGFVANTASDFVGVNGSALQYQLFSIAASVAANALTATLNPCALTFRSATATTGTPVNFAQTTALNITVPSGATLGAVSAQAARFVVAVAYNAGTPVLCIANSPSQVDESNLISPTTISAGATVLGAWYSASAVSANSPYRIVGFVDNTQATAGTYTTAPSLVQPMSPAVLSALAGFGMNQSWQTVTRTSGTTYYNTTGKPIVLSAFITTNAGVSASTSISINGGTSITFVYAYNTISVNGAGFISIPAGAYYTLTDSSVAARLTYEQR